MLDHMTFRVANLARSRAFYVAALAPLGYTVLAEFAFEDQAIVGFGTNTDHGSKIDTWLIAGPSAYGVPVTTGCHLAWRARSRAAVDAFYSAALAAGGTGNGAAGLRPHYHPNYPTTTARL